MSGGSNASVGSLCKRPRESQSRNCDTGSPVRLASSSIVSSSRMVPTASGCGGLRLKLIR